MCWIHYSLELHYCLLLIPKFGYPKTIAIEFPIENSQLSLDIFWIPQFQNPQDSFSTCVTLALDRWSLLLKSATAWSWKPLNNGRRCCVGPLSGTGPHGRVSGVKLWHTRCLTLYMSSCFFPREWSQTIRLIVSAKVGRSRLLGKVCGAQREWIPRHLPNFDPFSDLKLTNWLAQRFEPIPVHLHPCWSWGQKQARCDDSGEIRKEWLDLAVLVRSTSANNKSMMRSV